jgi:hypothetical protein
VGSNIWESVRISVFTGTIYLMGQLIYIKGTCGKSLMDDKGIIFLQNGEE